jgi:hypothetical protein
MISEPFTPSSIHFTVDAILKNIANDIPINLTRVRRGVAKDSSMIHAFLHGITTSSSSELPNRQDVTCGGELKRIIPNQDSLEKFLMIKSSGQDGLQPVFILVEDWKEDTNDWRLCSLAQWSFGYSTWKGRVMNLNTLISGTYEALLMKILILTARELKCMRIVHQVRKLWIYSWNCVLSVPLMEIWPTQYLLTQNFYF